MRLCSSAAGSHIDSSRETPSACLKSTIVLSLSGTLLVCMRIHELPTHGERGRQRERERERLRRVERALCPSNERYKQMARSRNSEGVYVLCQQRTCLSYMSGAKAAVDKQQTVDYEMTCLSAQGRRTASGPARCRNSLAGEAKILALSWISPR